MILLHVEHHFALCIQIEASEDGPPSAIHLLPAGPMVRGKDGREWRLSSAENVAAKFDQKIPIDINHSTQRKAASGDESPAVGFITGLESRDTGIWGLADWNPRGKEILNNKEYAFISPVFSFDPDLNDSDTGEISQLQSAALTNNPNLRLTALNTTKETKEHKTDSQGEKMDRVKGFLSLEANSTEDDVIRAIEMALNVKEEETTKKISLDSVPKEQYEKACNSLRAVTDTLEKIELEKKAAEIDTFIDKAKAEGKIIPACEAKYRALCAMEDGLEHARGIIESMPVLVKLEPVKGLEGVPKFAEVSLTEKDKIVMNNMDEDRKKAYLATRERMVASGKIRGA